MPEAQAHLNPEQLAAVTHDAGPLIVLAGPGTGKTRVIVHRIAHMLSERGIAPERILAVTYTTRAAQQMRERLAALVGPRAEQVHAHTFHAMGFRIIRRFAHLAGLPRPDADTTPIIDSAQQSRLFRSIVLEHNLFPHARARGIDAIIEQIVADMDALDNAGITVPAARVFLSRARESLASGTNALGHPLDAQALASERERLNALDETLHAIDLFRAACRERSWLTFSDLITLPIHILQSSPRAAALARDEYRHIVVDEFQDANTAQIELLRLLAPPERTPDLCVVGDDDQSIYNFRGADDLAFKRFAEIWTDQTTIRLSSSFRSTPPIVAVSGAIMSRAATRFAPDKAIVAAREHPSAAPIDAVHLEDDKQDAEVIASMILLDRAESAPPRPWSSYAVVAKTNADLERICATLRIEGIPCSIRRPPSIMDDAGVQDVFAWMRLLVEPRSTYHALRILTRPPYACAIRDLQPLESRYRALRSRADAGEPSAPDPGPFMDWLAVHAPADPLIAKAAAMHADLRTATAHQSAMDAIFRIITSIDAAHAELLPAAERAARVAALVTLVRFARTRQDRLDAPGDLRAFLAYYDDLSPGDQKLSDTDRSERLDAPGSENDDPDAVRLVTAHSAKGLEFDTVFVPRVTPQHGYGSVRTDDDPPFPAGLLSRDDRSPRERALAEARRLFYVACTRAERRLVLLSKKTKHLSSSTHFFQELIHDPSLKAAIRILEGADLLKQAATRGLGLAALGPSSPLDVERPSAAPRVDRRDLFERAQRDTRLAAAGAIERAGASVDPSEALASLEQSARRLAALQFAERTGRVPAWATGTDAGTHAEQVLARAGGAAPSAPSTLAFPPLSAPLSLSYTFISDYLRCPRCFYVKHVLKLEPAPEQPAVVGSAIHAALEQFYQSWRNAEIEESHRPEEADLLALGRRAFFARWPRHIPVDRAKLDQVLAQLSLMFRTLHDPTANIIELEKVVRFPYGSHTMEARLDRIDQIETPAGLAFRLIDYKTGEPTQHLLEPEADDLQLGIYAMALSQLYGAGDPALDRLPGFAEYWILAEGARGTLDLASIQFDKVRRTIDKAISGMLAGNWSRSPRIGTHECDILGAP